MPIYEYKCSDNDCLQKTFEKLAKLEDHDKKVFCPKCNKIAIKLVSSSFGFSLKGSGFHVNDYPTPDRYIGEDADKKWNSISNRQSKKKNFKKENSCKHLDKITSKEYIASDKELYKINHTSEI